MKCQHYVTVKKYRDKYKVVVMPGYHPNKKKSADAASYDSKLENNLSRARQKIFEYAYCNDWEWFVTLTLDKEKFDRYDLEKWHKSLTKWLQNYKRKTGLKISFLLVPEQHKDGAWHAHGLLAGLPESVLQPFEPGTPLHGSKYLNWSDYAEKYGFVSVGRVGNHEAVSKYITKYVTKDMARLNQQLHARLYYNSRGLKTAEAISSGFVYSGNLDISPDYEGEYCSVRWYDEDQFGDALRIFSCDETIRGFDLNDFDEIEV